MQHTNTHNALVTRTQLCQFFRNKATTFSGQLSSTLILAMPHKVLHQELYAETPELLRETGRENPELLIGTVHESLSHAIFHIYVDINDNIEAKSLPRPGVTKVLTKFQADLLAAEENSKAPGWTLQKEQEARLECAGHNHLPPPRPPPQIVHSPCTERAYAEKLAADMDRKRQISSVEKSPYDLPAVEGVGESAHQRIDTEEDLPDSWCVRKRANSNSVRCSRAHSAGTCQVGRAIN